MYFSQTNSLGTNTSNTVSTQSVNPTVDTVFVTTNTPGGTVGSDIYYRAIFSNSPGVSTSQLEGYSSTFISRNTEGTLFITTSDLKAFGFSSGQTIYVKSIAESFWSNDYYDQDLARHIFPNANESGSTERSFTLP